jgi:hypothetical protein
MSFETWLLINIFTGAIGFGYFIYGKKQSKAVPLICGIGLMVYGYAVESLSLTIIIGIILIALPWFYRPQ